MTRRRLAALTPLVLAACATTVDGPARLAGQQLDAATALYGRWADEIVRDGRSVYIWRRSVQLSNGESRSCELRVSLGFRKTIRSAVLEGFEDACRLYDVRYKTVTR
jgi:hypothetical protein